MAWRPPAFHPCRPVSVRNLGGKRRVPRPREGMAEGQKRARTCAPVPFPSPPSRQGVSPHGGPVFPPRRPPVQHGTSGASRMCRICRKAWCESERQHRHEAPVPLSSLPSRQGVSPHGGPAFPPRRPFVRHGASGAGRMSRTCATMWWKAKGGAGMRLPGLPPGKASETIHTCPMRAVLGESLRETIRARCGRAAFAPLHRSAPPARIGVHPRRSSGQRRGRAPPEATRGPPEPPAAKRGAAARARPHILG